MEEEVDNGNTRLRRRSSRISAREIPTMMKKVQTSNDTIAKKALNEGNLSSRRSSRKASVAKRVPQQGGISYGGGVAFSGAPRDETEKPVTRSQTNSIRMKEKMKEECSTKAAQPVVQASSSSPKLQDQNLAFQENVRQISVLKERILMLSGLFSMNYYRYDGDDNRQKHDAQLRLLLHYLGQCEVTEAEVKASHIILVLHQFIKAPHPNLLVRRDVEDLLTGCGPFSRAYENFTRVRSDCI